MRDRWYSDDRDLVKWATLVHLAKRKNLNTILQVAFYRPEITRLRLESPNGQVPFPTVVLEHFPRDIKKIETLGHSAKLDIQVFSRPFVINGKSPQAIRASRAKYLDSVVNEIKHFHKKSLLVFLDPDTGMARQVPALTALNMYYEPKFKNSLKPSKAAIGLYSISMHLI